MVAHACNFFSTWESETGGLLLVPGQLERQQETLSQKCFVVVVLRCFEAECDIALTDLKLTM